MHECQHEDAEGNVNYEHQPADAGGQACYCIQPVLGRLGGLKHGQQHPHCPNADDVYLARITPFVLHTCDRNCFDRDGKLLLLHTVDGFGNADAGQPAHADGAVSLPPLDPRPELRRIVMKETMRVIAADIERDEKAAAAGQAKKRAGVSKMMPDNNPYNPMGDMSHFVPGGVAGGSDGGMSQQANKKQAVLEVLEQPSEGQPPSGGGGGGWFGRGS